MNKSNRNKTTKSILLLSVFIMICTLSSAFAWGGGHRGGGFHGGWGGFHDHYWGGYGWGWRGYPSVVISGYPYYYDAPDYYYSGYPATSVVTVAEPVARTVVVAAAQTASPLPAVPKQLSGDTTVINVPISNDKFTPVKVIKYANGYIGPQGEFYPNHPTIAQLQALYGN